MFDIRETTNQIGMALFEKHGSIGRSTVTSILLQTSNLVAHWKLSKTVTSFIGHKDMIIFAPCWNNMCLELSQVSSI